MSYGNSAKQKQNIKGTYLSQKEWFSMLYINPIFTFEKNNTIYTAISSDIQQTTTNQFMLNVTQ